MHLVLEHFPLIRSAPPPAELHGAELAAAMKRFMSTGLFEMPIGAKIVGLVGMNDGPNGEAPCLLAMVPPNAVRVTHEVLVCQFGIGVDVPLGRTIPDEPLGIYFPGAQPLAIFKLLPWPAGALPVARA